MVWISRLQFEIIEILKLQDPRSRGVIETNSLFNFGQIFNFLLLKKGKALFSSQYPFFHVLILHVDEKPRDDDIDVVHSHCHKAIKKIDF